MAKDRFVMCVAAQTVVSPGLGLTISSVSLQTSLADHPARAEKAVKFIDDYRRVIFVQGNQLISLKHFHIAFSVQTENPDLSALYNHICFYKNDIPISVQGFHAVAVNPQCKICIRRDIF